MNKNCRKTKRTSSTAHSNYTKMPRISFRELALSVQNCASMFACQEQNGTKFDAAHKKAY